MTTRKRLSVHGLLLASAFMASAPARAYYVGIMKSGSDRAPAQERGGLFGRIFGGRGGGGSRPGTRPEEPRRPSGPTRRVYSTNRRTHLVVIGQADDAGTSFFRAGLTRALRYRELFPDDQIVVTINHERLSSNATEKEAAQYQRTIADTASLMDGLRSSGMIDFIPQMNRNGEPEKLGGDLLMELLAEFSPGMVASLDLYGHSSTHLGIGLETGQNRLNIDNNGIPQARRAFEAGAFVTISSCNSGFFLARYLAQQWRDVAVLGTFTEANYMRPHEDGNYYFDDRGLFPEDSPILRQNKLSFFDPPTLPNGKTFIRLHPGNAAYGNMWSVKKPVLDENGRQKIDEDGKPMVKNFPFETGLGFFKAFCPEINSNGQGRENCLKGIAGAFLSYPNIVPLKMGSPIEDFKKAAADYLCTPAMRSSKNASMEKRESCLRAIASFDKEIEEAEASGREAKEIAFSSFSAKKPLECTFSDCFFDISFDIAGDGRRATCRADHSCSIEGVPTNRRFADIGRFAARNSINIVATTDGGDKSLFREYRALMRGVKRYLLAP